jgi:hypothetical protein
MGPKAGLEMCGKSRPPPGFDPRTGQPVASRYTNYANRPTNIDASLQIELEAEASLSDGLFLIGNFRIRRVCNEVVQVSLGKLSLSSRVSL